MMSCSGKQSHAQFEQPQRAQLDLNIQQLNFFYFSRYLHSFQGDDVFERNGNINSDFLVYYYFFFLGVSSGNPTNRIVIEIFEIFFIFFGSEYSIMIRIFSEFEKASENQNF